MISYEYPRQRSRASMPSLSVSCLLSRVSYPVLRLLSPFGLLSCTLSKENIRQGRGENRRIWMGIDGDGDGEGGGDGDADRPAHIGAYSCS